MTDATLRAERCTAHSDPPAHGLNRYSGNGANLIDIHITQPDLEDKLTHSAAQQGRNPDELVQDVLTQYFDEEDRFAAAVKRGDASIRRGEYLTHEEVDERLKRFLQLPDENPLVA